MRWPFALHTWSSEERGLAEQIALKFNDLYVENIVEGHNLCPYAREARRRDEAVRSVHFQATSDLDALLESFCAIARRPQLVVAQVIVPGLSVGPQDWIDFCHRVTRLGHDRLGGPEVMANAALHPGLAFHQRSPYALIPLFRRAPDPTIQWVRLTELERLYEGRAKGSTFVDPAEIVQFLQGKVTKSLYDRIAEANRQTAERIGVAALEADLGALHARATEEYRQISLRG